MNERLEIHFLLKEDPEYAKRCAEEVTACLNAPVQGDGNAAGAPEIVFRLDSAGDIFRPDSAGDAFRLDSARGVFQLDSAGDLSRPDFALDALRPAPAGGALQDSRTPARRGRAGTVLYITDSGRICRTLADNGLPVVGYLHEGNRGTAFPGARYLIEHPQEVDADSWVKIYQRLTGQPWIIAVTPRLLIREMTSEDLDALYVLYEDPQARRFLTPPQEDRAAEAEILKAYIEKIYGFYGYGMWAVCERGSGDMIGRVGFAPMKEKGRAPELGYLIRADRRGEGLAAEAVMAALAFAGGQLGFLRVGAYTAADNEPSAALLRKAGFQLCGTPSDGGFPEGGQGYSEVDDSARRGILYFEKKL